MGYSYDKNKFVEVKSSALCDYDKLEGLDLEMENCNLYMKHTIDANSIGFLAIKFTPKDTLGEDPYKVDD